MIKATDVSKLAETPAAETPATASSPTLEDRCTELEAQVKALQTSLSELTASKDAAVSSSSDDTLTKQVHFLLGRAGVAPGSIQ